LISGIIAHILESLVERDEGALHLVGFEGRLLVLGDIEELPLVINLSSYSLNHNYYLKNTVLGFREGYIIVEASVSVVLT